MNLPKAGTSIPQNRFPESSLHSSQTTGNHYTLQFSHSLSSSCPMTESLPQVLPFHLGEELRISFYSGLAYGGGVGWGNERGSTHCTRGLEVGAPFALPPGPEKWDQRRSEGPVPCPFKEEGRAQARELALPLPRPSTPSRAAAATAPAAPRLAESAPAPGSESPPW